MLSVMSGCSESAEKIISILAASCLRCDPISKEWRPPQSPAAGLPRRHPLGAQERGPLESRFQKRNGARTVSLSVHVLAAAQGMDRVRFVPRRLANVAEHARPARPFAVGRSDRGRHVFPGKTVCVVRRPAERGKLVGLTKRGKGSKIMLLVDGNGVPLAVGLFSANDAEVLLIEPLLDAIVLDHRKPERLIYDQAADSDPLRERLWEERVIELVCSHRRGRRKPPTQDGRKLRRAKCRWPARAR